jgi:D-alanyl-D-alanine carboxypeptidase
VKRLLFALAVVIVAGAGVAAAQPAPSAVPRAVAALRKAGAPAVVVEVAKNGSASTVVVSGFADTARRTPAVAADHFRAGSITKIFVSTVVLQLVGEGKLSLSDTVAKRLPGLVPNGGRISVRELLQHTSGLYDYTDDPRLFAPYLTGNLAYAWHPRQLVKFAVSHKPLFAPGVRWSYSNTNYVLLGLIVQAVTKDTLAGELERRILRPLGLHETRFATGSQISAPAAHGYFGGRDISGLSGSAYWAAGAMVSTARDLARFLSALLGGKLLRPQQLRAMETTVPINSGVNSYGLGLIHVVTTCGAAWGHNGIVPGYSSWAISSPDGKRQAVVLASSRAFPNAADYEAAINALAQTAFCS